jgi:RNA polymerase sigma-70 factor, ECF subfamily
VGKNKQQLYLELYEPIHSQLTRFCRAIAGNTEDAEDLMNDTILASFESFEKLRDPAAFKPYLFRIASNINRLRFRHKKYRAEFNEAEAQKLADMSGNPEHITEFGLVYEKILALPARTSEALVLFYLNDLSLEEIQKVQGGSLSGVKLRLKRGREKLLESLNSPAQFKMALMLLTL